MMARYFVQICYDGSEFAGWQIQQNAKTVQGVIEDALKTLLGHSVKITGCGRTDTGVHASQYFFHFDSNQWNEQSNYKLNAILPKSIAVLSYSSVTSDAHARFHATGRQYDYYAHFDKNPFKKNYSSYIVPLKNINIHELNETAELISSYEEFFPFCKSNHDAHTMHCDVSYARWQQLNDGSFQFTIKSNRFLRGMVRLIVGACIHRALGKIELSEIKEALDFQVRLNKPWSAPAQGLFLSGVEYPEDLFVL